MCVLISRSIISDKDKQIVFCCFSTSSSPWSFSFVCLIWLLFPFWTRPGKNVLVPHGQKRSASAHLNLAALLHTFTHSLMAFFWFFLSSYIYYLALWLLLRTPGRVVCVCVGRRGRRMRRRKEGKKERKSDLRVIFQSSGLCQN